MSLIAIVQARMGSSRYPGKVLAPLAGIPLIARVIERTRLGLPANTPVWLATTTNRSDDPLVYFCERLCHVFRGSEDDVLERTYQCALSAKAKHCVRITGDTPLLDPTLLRSGLGDYFETKADYHGFSNSEFRKLGPDGADFECFSFDALERARNQAKGVEREHVTLWMIRNCNLLAYPATGFEDCHYSINTLDDLHHAEELIRQCGESMPMRIYATKSRELRLPKVDPLELGSLPETLAEAANGLPLPAPKPLNEAPIIPRVPGRRLKKNNGQESAPEAVPGAANEGV